jgi:hypothetical protein
MNYRRASVAKWTALAIVPVGLMATVWRVAEPRRAEAATQQLQALIHHGAIMPSEPIVPELKTLIERGANVNARWRRWLHALA